ncbi:MAG: adenylate/guanylate cyclase domain-containing protein [Verrucomicrobiia bacterium]
MSSPSKTIWWKQRQLILATICLLCTAISTFLSLTKPLQRAQLSFEDTLLVHGRQAPKSDAFEILALDPNSMLLDQSLLPGEIEQIEPLRLLASSWPISRAFYAAVLDKLAHAGARLVFFDFMFPREGQGDPAFQEAIERHANIVLLASNLAYPTSDQGGSIVFSLPSPSLLPSQDIDDPRTALVNFWSDDLDGVTRRARYRLGLWQIGDTQSASPPPLAPGEPVLYTFAGQTLRRLGLSSRIPQPDGSLKRFRFAGPPGTFQPRPIHEIFLPKFWEQNFHQGEIFRDKIVMIGPYGNFFKDELRTPFALDFPGPELHLHALNAALHGEFLDETTRTQNYALLLTSGLLALALGHLIPKPERRLWAGLALSLVFLLITILAYNYGNLFLYCLLPLINFNAIGLFGFSYEFILERLERNRTRSMFERYMSKNVVREILDQREAYEALLGGTRKPVTVLFSDVRGFTTLTESADSTKLVEQLNQYLTAMVGCVFQAGGTLDKFIGDAVMAVWGNTLEADPRADARRGVLCALDMLKALRELNEIWQCMGTAPFHIGIGLNHGEVIVGNMGSPERMEFTVIGDAVNLASRLESLTKEYGLELIIGEKLAELVRDDFHLQSVDLVQVKGKTQPVEIFTVHGPSNQPLPPDLLNYLQPFEQGIRAFRARDFTGALIAFRQALAARPDDFLAADYIEQAEACLIKPPPPDWTGVRVMTKK